MRRWQVVLLSVLVVLTIVGGILYSQREAIFSYVFETHIVGGDPQTASLHVPAGFHVNIFASGLLAPRFIAFAPDGTLFVAERSRGNIVAFPDPQHTGTATGKLIVASGLDDPTSLVFYQNALYVGEADRITRFTLDTAFKVTSKQVIVAGLPKGGQHNTRTVLIGPDEHIYVAIGSDCNVCIESDPHRAAIWTYNLDGSGGHLYAKGLRNAVGMAINPWNNQIWVTNNGRDLMGDNIPPETLYALQNGANYGWPRCHAGDIIDPDFGKAGDCNGVVAPLAKMQAHSAPLGLAFYTATQFPQQYRGVFIAFHGSWNRSVPTGYKVVFLPLNQQGQVAGTVQDFVTGWLANTSNAMGRPVGLAVGPDGTLYISDDKAGVVYRVSYIGK